MRAIWMAAALGMLAAAGAATGASAQPPPPPSAPTCVGLSGNPQAANVWWGQFSGGRMEPLADGAVAPVGISTEGCFSTRQACERWLYRMKGAYSALLPATSTGCRLGYRGIY